MKKVTREEFNKRITELPKRVKLVRGRTWEYWSDGTLAGIRVNGEYLVNEHWGKKP